MEKKIILKYKVNRKESISNYLQKKSFSYSNIYNLIEKKHVFINNLLINTRNYIVKRNDEIKVILNDEANTLKESEGKIDIIYEDEYFLVVNKPEGLNIEPVRYHLLDNLASFISYYYKQENIKSKIHFVNRLDKDSQGLVILAKNQYLQNVMKKVKIIKKYECLVKGKTPLLGYIRIKIMKDDSSIKRIISKNGKVAKTLYRRKSFDGLNSKVRIRILTGRTHQIRLSMAYINHPLIGDKIYNDFNDNNKMYLNAYYLSFIHPITRKKINLKIN